MPTFISSLFDPIAAGRLLPILAEATIKGTILLGVAAVLAVVMRNRAAAARHLVWTGALVGAVVLPFFSAISPQWRVAVLPAAARVVTTAPPLPNAASLAKLRDDLAALDHARMARGPREVAAVDDEAQRAITAPAAEPATPKNALLVAITSIWAAGALAILFVLLVGNLGVQALARTAEPVRDRRLLDAAAAIARELGIARRVAILRAHGNQMPATWGIVHPALVLPAAAESWTPELQRVVLLHELSHVRRFDALTQLLAQLCCMLYWFNPAVWHAARRMREERERACDEAVLGGGADACGYADQLTRIAREFRSPRRATLAALSMARRSQLEGRLLAILDAGQRRPLTRRGSATLTALLGACAVSLAAMHPVREASRPVGPTAPVATAPVDDRRASPVVTDTVRMSFPMRAGQWLEVIGVWGNITAVPTTGREVEIIAVKKSQDGGRAALDRVAIEKGENDAGVKVCARYPRGGGRTPCNVRGREQYDATDVIVSFVVHVPVGVKLAAHTIMGNVTATRMSEYVWGTSATGNIVVSTAAVAEASTGAGNITASLGATTWTENLEFETGAGHVVVEVPAALRSNVEAETADGAIGNDFGLVPKTTRDTGRIFGHVGAPGGGMLWLRTTHGNVFIRKAKGRDPRDLGALDSLGAIGTPRGASAGDTNPNPNPNPNPGDDPNPNPNPDFVLSASPSPSPSPSPSGSPSSSPSPSDDLPAAVDAPYKISSGGVTDERVAQYVAGGFLRRFTPRAASGMRDSAAIVKLASLALPRWISYQAGELDPDANLVGDRAIWALTLVHMDGRIFEGVIGNLRDNDWRVRAYAAWVLGVVGEGRATEALLEAASDYHWRVRMHAAFALGEYRAKSSLPRLIELLSDEHYQVRTAAVDALAAIGDASAVPALRAMARDPHMMVRQQALAALAALDNS